MRTVKSDYNNAYEIIKDDDTSTGVYVCNESHNISESLIETEGGKKYYFEGTATQAELVNGNSRKYLIDEMVSECDGYQSLIVEGRAVGELNHPHNPSINPERIALKIVEYKRIGDTNDFYHKSQVLDYGLGKLIIGHMDNGIQLATSSRGLAKFVKKGDIIIAKNFKLITPADIVWNNSAPDAIPKYVKEDILNMAFEEVDIMNGIYSKEIDCVYNTLHTSSKFNLNDSINKAYEQLMNVVV